VRCFVTGSAGFIGSTVVDRLLALDYEVVGLDNFSTGKRMNLADAEESPRFTQVEADILDSDAVRKACDGCDIIFHLAANADVRFGTHHPYRDLEQNVLGTYSVLEAMRATGVRNIAFSSTGSVYGEATTFPTPEDAPFPVQTSLYGASKASCEGLISAYCEGFDFTAFIFRFVSILGERYSHGHVFDFYKKLKENPTRLQVLGDGHQRKSYLYVQDCIEAMLLAVEQATDQVNIFNLGQDDYCEVNDSIGWITEHLGISPVLEYTGGDRGWVGDNPFIFLDCSSIKALGWRPRVSIRDGVIKTLDFLIAEQWVLEPQS